jgi:L-threonylcarbamoyladenylate synthase
MLTNITIKDVKKAAEIIKQGGLVAFPTETVYALACDPYNEHAVRRIYEIKGRGYDKPLSLLANSLRQIEKICYLSPKARSILHHFSPGPITLICNVKEDLNIFCLTNINKKTIGIRIPNHKIALDIIDSVGYPIFATSVNKSGEKAATNASEIINRFEKQIDMIIDGGEVEIGVSSTVVDVTKDEVVILRQGSIKQSEILSVI